MEKAYHIFLMIELAKLAKVINVSQPYDEMWETGNKLYTEFEQSTFNVDSKSEYDCIREFLTEKSNSLEENLKWENNVNLSEFAKDILRDEGYFVDNLWHIEDVKSKFICDDDDTANEVLESALTNEATMEQIWFAILYVGGELHNLTKKHETE